MKTMHIEELQVLALWREWANSQRKIFKRKAKQIYWGTARIFFFVYIIVGLCTVVTCFLGAPLTSWYFYGDWRFWRYWNSAWRLFPHGWRIIYYMVTKPHQGFMFSVPLTSPPANAPNHNIVQLSPSWAHGSSCHTCSNCCTLIHCPILDSKNKMCRGYNSFFWRYFNCGRYPSKVPEIDFYGCPKWLIRPHPSSV